MLTRILNVLVVLAVLLPAQAEAWWDQAWSYRMKVSLDATAVMSAQLDQVPVAVRLHNGNFAFFGCNQDGSDIRFVAADDKTPLPYHIDRYDAANGIAVVWVRLPNVGSKDAPGYFWLYYGNPEAKDAQNAGETYDRNQSLVLHFGGKEDSPRDSSAYANHPVAMKAVVTSAGVIDSALKLDGQTGLRIPASPSMRLTANQGFSLSVWVKPDSAATESVLYAQREGKRALMVVLDAKGVYARIEHGNGGMTETPHVALTPGAWQHLGVIAAGRLALFVGGREAASAAGRMEDMGGDVLLGMEGDGRRGMAGELDELQMSNIARSAAWMRIVAAQGPDGTLLSYGEEEAEGTGGGSAYGGILKVLADSVSPEGWVIIALTVLLGLISLEAGVTKALYLGRMEKANRVFLSRMNSLPLDPSSGPGNAPLLEGQTDKDIRDSSLLRLYQRAMSELKRILEIHQQQGYGWSLTPQGVEALRSSLDVALVDEIGRMNDKLTLLTLAVSGGPFLGLLGTVVGIMITFTMIAASGDVNVNTIAPGVAAALTTTVVGLMIAIPAMFGYNHLATRVRNLTSAKEVFADELVGKIALAYALKGENAKTQPG
jgi:biopolymer transport protein ExbB